MAPSELLRDAVERSVVSGHEGKSGAGLERVRLADGRALVVKRVVPGEDLTLDLTGGGPAREYVVWSAGLLDRLPPGVGHAVVDAWLEGETTVIVMRDLGEAVLTWRDRLDRPRAFWVMERLAELHRAFLDDPPDGLAPLAYRRAAGPAYDERSMRLALLSGLLWLGWNKALDATEHPDPAIRRQEEADLDWWVRQARTTLERQAP